MIHREGVEGGIMIFMPGWSEISNVFERLGKVNFAHQLQVHALHSRLPSSEQKQIFQRPPLGKRKVVVATVLAETSITVEVLHLNPYQLGYSQNSPMKGIKSKI